MISNWSAAAPPAGVARSPDVDALRGFALLGVVVVNAPFFAHALDAIPEALTVADRLAAWATYAFGVGKFFLIFSLLFGFGFAVLLARSEARGETVDWSYFRRMGGLFVIGVAHAVFLFAGDILVLYSVLALALWLLRRRSDRVLLSLAAASLLVSVTTQSMVLGADYADTGVEVLAGAPGATAIGALAGAGADPSPVADPEPIPAAAGPAAAAGAGAGYLGTFREVTAQRLSDLPVAAFIVVSFNGPAAFAMFLLGYVVTRRGMFPPGEERRRRLRRPALLAFGVGALGSGVAAAVFVAPGAFPGGAKLAAGVALSVLAPLLSFSLVAAVLAYAVRRPTDLVVRSLAVVGRNSLSGYLLHSVLLGAVFFGWGLGLHGTMSPAGVLAVAVMTFGLIVILLQLWTRVFRYGPAEWVHRSFTELRWKPLLRTPDMAPDRPSVAAP